MSYVAFLSFILLLVPQLVQAVDTIPLEGDLTQGGMVVAQVEAGTSVWLDKTSIPVTPDGRAVFGFGRDFPQKAQLRIQTKDGKEFTQELDITQRDYKVQKINGLPPKKVNVPQKPKILERIHKESTAIKNARNHLTRDMLFDSGWIMPAKGRITGVYGSQRVLNGKPKRPHYGIDIAAPTGTPVLAPSDAIVRLVQNDNYYSGGTLILDHGWRISSAFLHMDSISVKVGQHVKQGEQIGTVGSTGRSTGPHLDWRINWGKERLDPQLLF